MCHFRWGYAGADWWGWNWIWSGGGIETREVIGNIYENKELLDGKG